MRARLLKLYGWLEQRIVPGLRFSQYTYLDVLRSRIPQDCVWVELGCGRHMFGSWMVAEEKELAARARRLIGVDLDWQGLKANACADLKILGGLESIPLQAGSCDVATANMVAEHLENPPRVLAEVRRILRPDGIFIVHTPNRASLITRVARWSPKRVKLLAALILEGRHEEDVFPTFYRFNGAAAIRDAARAGGLKVEEIRYVNSSAATALLGPLSVFELLYLRLLQKPRFAGLRNDLIIVLRRA